MESLAATTPIAAQTTAGPVHLTVADLRRSIGFYAEAVGIAPLAPPADGTVSLGAGGRELLVLTELPGARPVFGHTGLFHFALLLPTRPDLARWLLHAASSKAPITGMSDHFVSEAVYLRDPDGHGIEVYADRPRDTWRYEDGTLVMGTVALDTSDLLAELDGEEAPYGGMPTGTTMGHIHLHVADLEATEAFYRGVLGFDVTARWAGQATFMSAGGYHHHVAANTWAGRGATPPPAGSAALRMATIVLPDDAERDRVAGLVQDSGQDPEPVEGGLLVRDPSDNALLLTA